jgi:tRNA (cytidine/uridine-2'-O-)-methyltransferase
MDYWPRLKLTVHDDVTAFFHAVSHDRFWLLTSKSARSMWDAEIRDGDWLILGNETAGIAPDIVSRHADRTLRIPQAPGERCLNLATATGIVLYHALHQLPTARK